MRIPQMGHLRTLPVSPVPLQGFRFDESTRTRPVPEQNEQCPIIPPQRHSFEGMSNEPSLNCSRKGSAKNSPSYLTRAEGQLQASFRQIVSGRRRSLSQYAGTSVTLPKNETLRPKTRPLNRPLTSVIPSNRNRKTRRYAYFVLSVGLINA
jgi:hypothetical protein